MAVAVTHRHERARVSVDHGMHISFNIFPILGMNSLRNAQADLNRHLFEEDFLAATNPTLARPLCTRYDLAMADFKKGRQRWVIDPPRGRDKGSAGRRKKPRRVINPVSRGTTRGDVVKGHRATRERVLSMCLTSLLTMRYMTEKEAREHGRQQREIAEMFEGDEWVEISYDEAVDEVHKWRRPAFPVRYETHPTLTRTKLLGMADTDTGERYY
jgi:hypothetical protein